MKILWQPVVNFEGYYEVSNQGHVKSITRHATAGGILKPKRDKDGYASYVLCVDGVRKSVRGHRLVLEAFVGPSDKLACHRDGDVSNNCLSNLYWGTPKDNMRDRVRHGNAYGHGSVLTQFAVWVIKRMLSEGHYAQTEIGRMFGVSKYVIFDIKRGKTWRWVDEPEC
jgi:hypothetical protein